MKISQVKISNILGIKELELSPEGFTEISGRNGEGKTSVLEAIRAVVQSGHDATLLRRGESKGEAVLVLDDGTELSKTVTDTGSTSSVRRDGKKIASPATTIKALTDALSVNPVEFLTAPKKDRVKVLLESMPITLDTEKLAALSGIPVKALPGVHALHTIEVVRQQVYEDRTGTNRAVKEKDGTINQLRIAMPDQPGGIDGDENELRAKIAELQAARDAEKARIDGKLNTIQSNANKRILELRTTASEKIEGIKAAAAASVEAVKSELEATLAKEQAELADTNAKAGRVRQKAIDACAEAVAPITAAVEAIAANRDAASKRTVTLQTIQRMETELDDLKKDAAAQTAALDAIDAYKSELLASLPISGLEVRDGEVFRDGVPFDRLNTAQKVAIAFEIAKLRAGDLKVVCLDGIELMDSTSLAELKAQAETSGMQVFITKVSDGDFEIKTA